MQRRVAIVATVGACVMGAALVLHPGEPGAKTRVASNGSGVNRAEPPSLSTPTRKGSRRIVAGLDEPLIAMGATSVDEDRALDAAVAAYRAKASLHGDGFALKPLARFAESYPRSAWRVAVLTNLGFAYYRDGYFRHALDSWQAAWNEGRDVRDVPAKALVDRAVGELARMHARLGRADELEQLFRDVGDRPMTGPATESMTGAREGAWVMRNEPGIAYLCGPSDLKDLLIERAASTDAIKLLDQQRSGRRGVSLAQLGRLADRVKLRYRLIHRQPGQAIPVPSVVHWSVHHFAAIVGERDGGYLIKDPTFGFGTDELWVRRDAIDSETSGYFLVPADVAQDSQWRSVTAAEARRIYGMGYTGVSQVGSTTPGDDTIRNQCLDPNAPTSSPGGSAGMGMCGYNAHTMLGSLNLSDTPVGYAPAKGPPVYIRLTYNQREANQPAAFVFFNISPKWTLNVLSYIQDDPNAAGVSVLRYVAGGGSVSYPTNGGPYNVATGEFAPEATTQAVLARIPASGPVTSYELRMPDGGKQVFALPDGAATGRRRVFLTQIVDPAGNALTLNYDSQVRLTSITDATGRNTTFGYEAADPLLVTRIADPFGRAATLRYSASGQLEAITDVVGLTSSVEYDMAGLVKSLTTPYGTTTFRFGDYSYNRRFLEIVDPMGFAERIEFVHAARGIANYEPVAPPGLHNIYLTWRNSFYWDKHALPVARPTPDGDIDYTKAQISHWLHTNSGHTAPTLESTKQPLENRVWRTYPEQRWTYYESSMNLPASVSRVLDDGITTQVAATTYNRLGKPLTTTDPRGRQTVYRYASNDIDLLTVAQQISGQPVPQLATIATFTYNSQHLPITATDASGQTTALAYNPAGQVIAITDPQHHVISFGYDSLGRLASTTDASGAVVEALTYDAFDRVATRTDAAGMTVAYEYDALNRLTRAAYPDGTSEQYTYDRLDVASATDRRGKVTTYTHDANRRRTSVTDPLGQITRFDYYENGVLKSITDPNGHVTSWDIDLQSRPIAKHYADGKTETVTYEATTSRIASVTDALGQLTLYSYDIDDRVASISYTNAQHATAPVQFAYDPVFPRPVSMTDGTGQTVLAYHPISGSPMLGANRLRSVESPVAGSAGVKATVTYEYDELGRVAGKTVNGAPQVATYDAVGRLTTVTNPLDAFTYSYSDATSRVSAIASANGPRFDARYYGSESNALLRQLTYTPPGGGALLAKYGYTYDANGNVVTFTGQESETAGSARAATNAAGAGWTSGAARGLFVGGAVVALLLCFAVARRIWSVLQNPRPRHRFVFAACIGLVGYLLSCGGDGGGQVTVYVYDDAGRLTSASTDGDPNGPITYAYDAASNITSVTGGNASAATSYTATNAIASAAYDANGSPTALDGARYAWDAANRVTSVMKDGVETTFTYDGLGRVVRIVEKTGEGTQLDRAYTWCGRVRCLEHDNLRTGSPVSKQYFSQGVVDGNLGLYYVTDHLGSIRKLVDASGAIRAHYSYGPYGAATKLAGDFDSDIGYAGYATAAHTGLQLAMFRAYDPQHQRWLNRDPIGEAGGLNLYQYVDGNPLTFIDPTGLAKAIELGGGYTGRLDQFNRGGIASFEIHVFDSSGKEIGVYGQNGWINKHGFKGPTNMPTCGQSKLQNTTIDWLRRAGQPLPEAAPQQSVARPPVTGRGGGMGGGGMGRGGMGGGGGGGMGGGGDLFGPRPGVPVRPTVGPRFQ